MWLEKLVITNFRNISHSQICPAKNINLFYGDNGSGKTSLLECIHTLGTGRSFRTRKFNSTIQFNAKSSTVFSVLNDINNVPQPLGVSRETDGGTSIRLDDKNVASASEIAKVLPIIIINEQSFGLVEGSSKLRRQMLDWVVFHVKHSFVDLWRRYARAIKQRNALLRHGKMHDQLAAWDAELIAIGNDIHSLREGIFESIKEKIKAGLSEWGVFASDSLDIKLFRGWNKELSLEEALEKASERDLQYGYTTVGPHRADIKFIYEGKPANETLSRGQKKIVVAALYLSAIQVFEHSGKRSIFLIDDLNAELDETFRKLIAKNAAKLNTQLFVTGINKQDLLDCWDANQFEDKKLFHVKHGEIEEIPQAWSQ